MLLLPAPIHAQEGPETGLVWGCVHEYRNGSTEETERCGLGRYSDLCMWNEGVEECIAIFEIAEEQGPSNVLFLPGIKGSRLYDREDAKLWEPFGNHDIEDLMLDGDGRSLQTGIHTEPGDIMDRVALFTDIYGTFIEFMDGLVSDEVIAEWRAFPYDWRLSLDAVVNDQPDPGMPIPLGTRPLSSLQAALEELALTSKSGKVTIIAHSNGGLVAKKLMDDLGDEDAARLIDDVIFVGVPQAGAPQALGALLYGYKEGLPWWFPGIVSTATARRFAENAPMSYHLLPSKQYFANLRDAAHAVVWFDAEERYAQERASYGERIDSADELASFALARDGGRTKPHPGDFWNANVLNETLLAYAGDTHQELDAWRPPPAITLYQVAGTQRDTLSGIEFYEECILAYCMPRYRPAFVPDGDGVVPVQSAHLIPAAANVHSTFLDLSTYGFGLAPDRDHGTLLAIDSMHAFVQDVLERDAALPPEFLSEEPETVGRRTLRFFLHSPLTLSLVDRDGNRTGPSSADANGHAIPGSQYGSLGEVQYVIAPAGEAYRLELDGYDTGTFTLEIQEVDGGTVIASTTVAAIPASADTSASMSIAPSLLESGPLLVDVDGDGANDISLPIAPGITVYEAAAAKSARSSRASRTPVPGTEEEVLRLYLTLLRTLLEYLTLLQQARIAPYEHPS